MLRGGPPIITAFGVEVVRPVDQTVQAGAAARRMDQIRWSLWLEALHMFIATFIVVGFVVAAVYATGILRGRDDHLHRLGFTVAFAFAAVAALVQPVSGHLAGLRLAALPCFNPQPPAKGS